MQSDDDLQTTLSKWPFILGDVLLVATALAISILGDWQLSNWQVASCVISVALGAALFVLPYIVEFQVRLREEAEDRTADLRILQRRIVSAQEQVEAVVERMETFEAGLSNLAHAQQPDLAGPIQAFEGKIDPLNKEQAEQSAQLKALAKQVEALAKSLDAKADTSSAQVVESPEPEVATKAKVEEPEKAVLAEVTPDEPITKKTRAPRKPRTPEPSLLQRAIEQKQDKSSEAVSRIIESKSKKSPPEEAAVVEPKQKAPKPETKKATKVNKAKEPSPPAEKPEVKSEPPVEEDVTEPLDGVAITPAPTESVTEEPEAQPVESEDMFGDVVPSPVKKRVRTKKSDSAVVASVFIGIGNKPFVRGSGAGLNWDKGIAMEFVEIGKWQWIAPADLDEPVELQLFRNDEDADSSGKYTLELGQQLDLSPVF
jgi:chemotaxis protein histidine kinase CheA